MAISDKSPPDSTGAKDLSFIGKMREVSIAGGQKNKKKWKKRIGNREGNNLQGTELSA